MKELNVTRNNWQWSIKFIFESVLKNNGRVEFIVNGNFERNISFLTEYEVERRI